MCEKGRNLQKHLATFRVTFVTPKSRSASLPHTPEDDYTWSIMV